MVNTSWTWNHIHKLWWRFQLPKRVYPPCDTVALQRLPLDRKLKRIILVSIAQFRPEKNHMLQLQAFALARAKASGIPALGERFVHLATKCIANSRSSMLIWGEWHIEGKVQVLLMRFEQSHIVLVQIADTLWHDLRGSSELHLTCACLANKTVVIKEREAPFTIAADHPVASQLLNQTECDIHMPCHLLS